MVCSLASVSPGVLEPVVVVCHRFFLPVQLACSQRVPAGGLKAGQLDELGKEG